eukprot:TRINITY_DN4111_c0_g1_i1.p1 TRINITY_DN4111_c0_g1~~TRINITY_DN4111_c0_g1_i1.p1  ORF type:complete len:1485 (-),score=420.21 TRINITY_DN4111_c0_g1_i1:91-4545(-)
MEKLETLRLRLSSLSGCNLKEVNTAMADAASALEALVKEDPSLASTPAAKALRREANALGHQASRKVARLAAARSQADAPATTTRAAEAETPESPEVQARKKDLEVYIDRCRKAIEGGNGQEGLGSRMTADEKREVEAAFSDGMGWMVFEEDAKQSEIDERLQRIYKVVAPTLARCALMRSLAAVRRSLAGMSSNVQQQESQQLLDSLADATTWTADAQGTSLQRIRKKHEEIAAECSPWLARCGGLTMEPPLDVGFGIVRFAEDPTLDLSSAPNSPSSTSPGSPRSPSGSTGSRFSFQQLRNRSVTIASDDAKFAKAGFVEYIKSARLAVEGTGDKKGFSASMTPEEAKTVLVALKDGMAWTVLNSGADAATIKAKHKGVEDILGPIISKYGQIEVRPVESTLSFYDREPSLVKPKDSKAILEAMRERSSMRSLPSEKQPFGKTALVEYIKATRLAVEGADAKETAAKMPVEERKKILDTLKDGMAWVVMNGGADNDKLTEKYNEVCAVCNPILQKYSVPIHDPYKAVPSERKLDGMKKISLADLQQRASKVVMDDQAFAKTALLEYIRSTRLAVEGTDGRNGLGEMLDTSEKVKLLDALKDAMAWSVLNGKAEAGKIKEKHAALEAICAPIVQQFGGSVARRPLASIKEVEDAPRWWVKHKILPGGPDIQDPKTLFTECQRRKLGVAANGDIMDRSKFNKAIEAIRAFREKAKIKEVRPAEFKQWRGEMFSADHTVKLTGYEVEAATVFDEECLAELKKYTLLTWGGQDLDNQAFTRLIPKFLRENPNAKAAAFVSDYELDDFRANWEPNVEDSFADRIIVVPLDMRTPTWNEARRLLDVEKELGRANELPDWGQEAYLRNCVVMSITEVKHVVALGGGGIVAKLAECSEERQPKPSWTVYAISGHRQERHPTMMDWAMNRSEVKFIRGKDPDEPSGYQEQEDVMITPEEVAAFFGEAEDQEHVKAAEDTMRRLSHASGREITAPPPKRHLVLHMDVNKTIVLTDSVKAQNKQDYVLNILLAENAWGFDKRKSGGEKEAPKPKDEESAPWRLAGEGMTPLASLRRQRPKVAFEQGAGDEEDTGTGQPMTYFESLKEAYPGKEAKKRREMVAAYFTEPTAPGRSLRPIFDEFKKRASNVREDASIAVVNAFFESVMKLDREGYTFSVAFRSYGKDLPNLALEWNAFCEGKNNLFSDARFDGTKGSPDLRVHDDSIASWVRAAPDFYGLIWGDLDIEAEIKDGLKEMGGRLESEAEMQTLMEKVEAKRAAREGAGKKPIHTTAGLKKVKAEIERRTRQQCGLCFREYFPLWSDKGQKGPYGKALLLEPLKPDVLDVFFDDNILEDGGDTGIIDVRDVNKAPEESAGLVHLAYARRYHLVRADALAALRDDWYFYRRVREKEQFWNLRWAARKRLKSLFRKIVAYIRLVGGLKTPLPALPPAMDRQRSNPWKQDAERANMEFGRLPSVRAFRASEDAIAEEVQPA